MKAKFENLRGKLTIKHGFPFKGEYFESTGYYIVLTPGNFIEKGGFKRDSGKEKYYSGEIPPEYLHKKGDLIIAMTEQARGLLGSTAIVPESGIYLHNQRLGLVEPVEGKTDRLFLYYFFNWPFIREQIALTSTGSKVKHTSPNRLYNVHAKLPEFTDQIKIAKVLSDLDSKIDLNNRINSELEGMAKLIYDYWFVQFDFPISEAQAAAMGRPELAGKPYKSSGGKMVFNKELKREVPEGWKVKQLKEFAQIKKGTLITEKTADLSGNFKVVAAGLNYSYFHSVSNFDANTITLSASGANAGHINFWRQPIFASDCTTVRGATISQTIFLLHFLKIRQDYIYNQARGSAQPHVYPKDIEVLDIVIPPLELIEEYGQIVVPTNDMIRNNEEQNMELTNLRDWLLPMLMNGQVRVRGGEEEMKMAAEPEGIYGVKDKE